MNMSSQAKFDERDQSGRKGAASSLSAATSGGRAPRVMYLVFNSLIFDLLGFTMILPLLPSLLDYYRKQDGSPLYAWMESVAGTWRRTFLVSTTEDEVSDIVLIGGLLGSIFSLLQFATSPIVGALSDVYGRKPLLLLSNLGSLACYVLWSASSNFEMFVASRIIGGVSRGSVSICTTIVADVCSPQVRAKGMALVGAAFSVGFLIGPVIGAMMARSSDFWVTPALLAIGSTSLNMLIIMVLFSESLPASSRAGSIRHSMATALDYINPHSLFTFKPVQKLNARDKAHLTMTGFVYFTYLLIYSGLEYTIAFLTHSRFDYSRMDQGKMYFTIGLVMVIIQGGFVRRIPPRLELKAAYYAIGLLIPCFSIIAIAQSTLVLYVGILLYALSTAFVVPCLTSHVSRIGSRDQKGTIIGILRSIGALSRALGPLVFSTIYWSRGASFCYLLGSQLFIIPLFCIRSKLLSSIKED
ncbi:major facilitator superfamily domain-containing protein 10-like [Varroa jacobsoni]|uniref:major facilitator superfamily domain-containing protein 10-like n=1 Tax=Varroa jacobsoni TaxID=62625 RepID=UPI000BF38B9D|nr:major facilitator superfamily domain-containing protein 10-like [Varroa jacobsoni]XP_022685779.1 major facilitator superfamily domain-containing protein 10-like [Varroa jacobsoni]